MLDKISKDLEEYGIVSTESYFKDKTSLKIGGKIKYFIEIETIEKLQLLIKYLHLNKVPYFILGNGTNVLASDEDFDIVVISLKKLNKMTFENDVFVIDAGVNSMPCGTKITLMGYQNPLCLSMVPGTVGGAIYMNASSYGEDIKKYLVKVDYVTEQGELQSLDNFDEFSYRKSPFQTNKGIIVRGYFKFNKDNQKDTVENLQKAWAYKKATQPLKTKNAGCVFKNLEHKKAWEIIKENKLNNLKIGSAAVSSKHANFLINEGNASFVEMHALIEYIQKRVFENMNINLDLEIKILRPCDIIPYQ